MSHYHISIAVDKEDVAIIKRDLQGFVDESGGFMVIVKACNDSIPESPELTDVMVKLFVKLLVHLDSGHFEGLN